MNYFEWFDVEICFHPDLTGIRKRYLQLSKKFHPDFGEGEGEEELMKKTAFNNEAYKTLKDDYKRVRYVLDLKGFGIDEKDKMPSEFLMEMMDWNERIAEASFEEDKQKSVLEDFNLLKNGISAELLVKTEAFDQSGNEDLLKEIKEICLKQKYMLRLQDSINTFAPR